VSIRFPRPQIDSYSLRSFAAHESAIAPHCGLPKRHPRAIFAAMRKLMQSLARRLLPAARLEITLPTGIHVPIGSRDQISRFEEIFLARSYDQLLDQFPLPETVCDLGCNAGYFPLALEDRKRLRGRTQPTRYLCVDANPACVEIARRSLERNAGMRG
jgi:hypothetical protein